MRDASRDRRSNDGAAAGADPSSAAPHALVARLLPFLQQRRYEPGERVPSERELADRFRVSRGQIREALSFLEALRVIERRAKSGVYMAEGRSSVEALALYARLGIPLDSGEVRETVEMRGIHEIAAIRLACERRTEANLDRLRDILITEAAHVAAGENIAEDDGLFHGEIMRATQNGVFAHIVSVIYAMARGPRVAHFRDPARGRQSHDEHVRLLAAIDQRDADAAASLMAQHLHGADGYWRHLPATAPRPTSNVDAVR